MVTSPGLPKGRSGGGPASFSPPHRDPSWVPRISLRVPTCGTRSQNLFVTTSARTNYMRNSSIIRVQRHGNSVSEDLDFFHPSSISSFRCRLQSLFN
ncbi:hypothetical protein J6590_107967 [Homalodisca vitripennis]|nr:hypothetical protein J6590_107967 [Homalodisca vitripennis]